MRRQRRPREVRRQQAHLHSDCSTWRHHDFPCDSTGRSASPSLHYGPGPDQPAQPHSLATSTPYHLVKLQCAHIIIAHICPATERRLRDDSTGKHLPCYISVYAAWKAIQGRRRTKAEESLPAGLPFGSTQRDQFCLQYSVRWLCQNGAVGKYDCRHGPHTIIQ
jgi:hypothetical protein